ncbi:hypothetical protein A2U01_0105797, partial [Trifolium medium]|nr:hypothetical protein [Trifolium medium]
AGGQRVEGILNINDLWLLPRSGVSRIFHSNSFCAIHIEGRSGRRLTRGSPRLQRARG